MTGPSDHAPGPTPAVSVIIPHYNDLDNLKRCLDLLDRQTLPRERFEIVVADNNSACGLAAVAEVCGARARAVPAPKQGAGEARNAGVAAARGEVLAFIDSDCRPEPAWLERGVAALAGADFAGGEVVVVVEDRDRATAVEAFELAFGFEARRYVLRQNYCVTANMFVRRDVFEAVGPFRQQVAEDVDWGWRAIGKGYRLAYAPDSVVLHPARHDWDDLLRKWRRVSREMFLLRTEQPGGRLRWFVHTTGLFLSPATGLVSVMRNDNLRSPRERALAYVALLRLRAWRIREGYRLLLARV